MSCLLTNEFQRLASLYLRVGAHRTTFPRFVLLLIIVEIQSDQGVEGADPLPLASGYALTLCFQPLRKKQYRDSINPRPPPLKGSYAFV